MSRTWVLQSFVSIVSAVSASPFTGAKNPPVVKSLNSNVSHFTSPNLFFSPGDSTSVKALNIKCDGAQYGYNLEFADCKDAKTYISSGPDQRPWAKRESHLKSPHYVLPYRYMGDSGRCYIQIGLAEGYSIGYASLFEVQSAANAILLKCGAGDTVQGGSVTNIGADGGLTMFLSAYHADVDCRGTFEPRKTCVTILDEMETTQISQRFGPRNDPGTQVTLPTIIQSRDRKSSVGVFGKPDTTSWYQIWEAVMLVYSVCIRRGQGGSVKGLGDAGNLFVTMTARAGALSDYALTDLAKLI